MHSVMTHPTSIVESDCIGPGTRIWAWVHVLPGARLGANCNVCDHVYIEGGAVVGDNVTLKNNVCVWDGVTINDDVFVGPNVTFTNDLYPRSPRMSVVRERYAQRGKWLRPTSVGRGCSIGANATILPGVRLGEYCVVAAGAVVTRDVAPFSLVAGSPARVLGDVCRCGRRLKGAFSEAVCVQCGETPDDRRPVLKHTTPSPSRIQDDAAALAADGLAVDPGCGRSSIARPCDSRSVLRKGDSR